MSSFRKINYSLRPAKHAERKMMGEIFSRLSAFDLLDNYAYIGFGSVWFSDFILYHKTLGIRDMFSIERATGARKRFEENKPFNITMVFDEASRALPKLEWKRRNIVWLDYDGVLSTNILLDVRTVASNASSGSVLAVSIQCNQAQEIADAEEDPSGPSAMIRFRQNFGANRVSDDVTEDDLYGWPFGALCRDILKREIESVLSARNSSGQGMMNFTPIMDFRYQDDAKMTTIVGVFSNESEKNNLSTCNFDRFDFVRDENKLVTIEIPKLTLREIKKIERQLPLNDLNKIDLTGDIPKKDALHFCNMYRYFPNFAIIEG